MKPAPLWMTARQARCGVDDTDWAGVGVGEKTFQRLVREGDIPSKIIGYRSDGMPVRIYSRLALEEHARRNGEAA